MKTNNLDKLIKTSQVSMVTFIFLAMAPIIVIWYAVYIYNFNNIDNVFLYIIQIIADTISMMILLGLWLTILMDVVVEKHHRVYKKNDSITFLDTEPTVDVFITVYGEPLAVVSKTIKAAVDMDYPHNTIVLDDGKSNRVKKRAEELGAYYITRNKNVNAKAGNINNALKYSEADFFVILDADHIPKKELITALLPFMADDKIAMAQSPQSFSNVDNFIAAGTAQAQDVFYRYVCPSKNITNSSFSVGTNVLYRRKAIDSIGGMALSNSEDIWTTFLLHKKKWQTIFINKVLAVGLAPDTIIPFFKQQRRWAKGGLEILLENNPLHSKTLNLDQKIQYFISNSFFLVGIPILVYILMPIIFLLFGSKPLAITDGAVWLLHYIPYFVLYFTLTWLLLGQKIRIATMATALASFYPYLMGLFSVIFNTEQQWIATESKRSSIDPIMKWIWPHILLLVLSIFSLVIGWYNMVEFWATFFNSLWVALNIFLLTTFLVKAKYN